MAYIDFKDLLRRTAADKVLRDKTLNIAITGIQVDNKKNYQKLIHDVEKTK